MLFLISCVSVGSQEPRTKCLVMRWQGRAVHYLCMMLTRLLVLSCCITLLTRAAAWLGSPCTLFLSAAHNQWMWATPSRRPRASQPLLLRFVFRVSIPEHCFFNCHDWIWRAVRVPELPVRNCADISNNLVPRGTKESAIHMKAKVFFQRLYLVPRLRKIAPFVTSPSAPTSPPLARNYFSICVQFFSRVAPQFLVSTIRQVIWPSPGTVRAV